MRNDFIPVAFNLFCRDYVIWPSTWMLFNNFGNLSIYYIWNMQASNFSSEPYLKDFGGSQFRIQNGWIIPTWEEICLKRMVCLPAQWCILILLTDNNWFYSPWGCYLSNSSTLVFTTFEKSKHGTFR